MTGTTIQSYGNDIRFKIGDYFYFISSRFHNNYGPHIVIGLITDIKYDENHEDGAERGFGIYFRELFARPETFIRMDDFNYFNLDSPMGKESIICGQEEAKLIEILYG